MLCSTETQNIGKPGGGNQRAKGTERYIEYFRSGRIATDQYGENSYDSQCRNCAHCLHSLWASLPLSKHYVTNSNDIRIKWFLLTLMKMVHESGENNQLIALPNRPARSAICLNYVQNAVHALWDRFENHYSLREQKSWKKVNVPSHSNAMTRMDMLFTKS
jgi:hypothetical protein